MPMVDWPVDLTDFVIATTTVAGGYEFDGREIAPFDEAGARAFLKISR